MSNPARTYESYFVAPQFSPAAQKLVEAVRPELGERVLDVACGTGIVLRTASTQVGPEGVLAGVDMNPNMLAIAREIADEQGLSADLREAPADRLPFEDERFDVALCGHGLQFFPDKPAALAEMRRVLSKGGRVGVSVWRDLSHHALERAIFECIEHQLGVSGAAAPFSLGDEETLRGLLGGAGFSSVIVEEASISARFPDPGAFLARTVSGASAAIPAMQRLGETERDRVLERVMRDVEPHVKKHTVEGHVVKPMHAYIVHARRVSA